MTDTRTRSIDGDIQKLLAAAGAAHGAGRSDLVRQNLEAVVRLNPSHPQALNSLGVLALAANNAARAASLFNRAAAADPGEPALWMNVAKAQRLLQDDEAERRSLDRALAIDARYFMALVRKAELHQRLGEDAQATSLWQGVLTLASSIERPGAELTQVLEGARAFVADRMRGFADRIEADLADARSKHEPAQTRRFDAAVDRMFGRRRIYANVCDGLHFPFLPADEFFDRAHFPWMPELERQTATVQAEFVALADDSNFAPYVSLATGTPDNKWSPLDRSHDWSAYHLWREGQRDDLACARCPRTAAIIEALPLAQLPARTPTVFFSVLRPRTRIPPHTGVSNTRAIVHLPLVVPDGCGFRVGGETREWREGEAFAFDDTIEHEAWNDSDRPRAVLIFDVWNPHIAPHERELLKLMYQAADSSGFNPGRG